MIVPIKIMTTMMGVCFYLIGRSMVLLSGGGGGGGLFVDAVAVTATTDFDHWKRRHNKRYDVDSAEHRLRAAIYADNVALVDAHNAAYEEGYTSYRMTADFSPFADLTDDEFVRSYLMATPQNCSATTHTSSGRLRRQYYDDDDDGIPVPKTHRRDWRTQGIITPIKNQKHCGSCWTFSTTGCLEAHYCLQNGLDCTNWKGLAEQQLVDCAQDYNNFGCDGGLPSQAFEYIKYAGGIDLEASYPYMGDGSDGLCKTSLGKIGVEVAEVYNITSNDEDDLQYAVAAIGPVSIAYQVSHDFRFYQHGVYDSYNVTTNATMCGNMPMDVNHAVVAVGLDETEDGIPFYIVRNSWGTEWGMEGYFWIKRGENLCGLSDCASFPIVPAPSSSSFATDIENAGGADIAALWHSATVVDGTSSALAVGRRRKLRSSSLSSN